MRKHVWETSKNLAALASVMIFLIFTSGCDRDECSSAGANWCKNNTHYACENDGSTVFDEGPPNYLVIDECAKYGATCIEEILYGDEAAYCGYTERKCTTKIESLCFGEYIGFCSTFAIITTFPEALKTSLECENKGWGCLQGTTDMDVIQATCTYVPEPCTTEGEKVCHESEFGNNVLECQNGVWVPEVCGDSRICCIHAFTEIASCVNIEDQATFCVQ